MKPASLDLLASRPRSCVAVSRSHCRGGTGFCLRTDQFRKFKLQAFHGDKIARYGPFDRRNARHDASSTRRINLQTRNKARPQHRSRTQVRTSTRRLSDFDSNDARSATNVAGPALMTAQRTSSDRSCVDQKSEQRPFFSQSLNLQPNDERVDI